MVRSQPANSVNSHGAHSQTFYTISVRENACNSSKNVKKRKKRDHLVMQP